MRGWKGKRNLLSFLMSLVFSLSPIAVHCPLLPSRLPSARPFSLCLHCTQLVTQSIHAEPS
ncbi:unnamed protein product [Ixodes persulcatus]